MAFTRVTTLDELWSGEMMSVPVDGKKILLVRLADDVRAYEDKCAHLGVALSEGHLDGEVLTCRAHHWTYDIGTGRGINPRTAVLKRFATKVEAGEVFVDVEQGSGARERMKNEG